MYDEENKINCLNPRLRSIYAAALKEPANIAEQHIRQIESMNRTEVPDRIVLYARVG